MRAAIWLNELFRSGKLRGLPPIAHSVLLSLLAHSDNDGESWPSQSRLAEGLGVHRTTVARALSALRCRGIISTKRQRRASCVYVLVGFDVAPAVHQDPPRSSADATPRALDVAQAHVRCSTGATQTRPVNKAGQARPASLSPDGPADAKLEDSQNIENALKAFEIRPGKAKALSRALLAKADARLVGRLIDRLSQRAKHESQGSPAGLLVYLLENDADSELRKIQSQDLLLDRTSKAVRLARDELRLLDQLSLDSLWLEASQRWSVVRSCDLSECVTSPLDDDEATMAMYRIHASRKNGG